MNNKDIYKMLLNIIKSDNVLTDEDMKKHTSFKIGGTADFLVKAENVNEIRSILKFTNEDNIPLTIIGNGTNLLVKDNGIRGIVLKVNINNIQIQTNPTIVTVGAGVPLGLLAQKLMAQSISGFEFASGIPGTIGGAITMNAGAYGKEFKDIVIETTYMDENGEVFTINNQQHNFEYRNSKFKNGKYIILETKLSLECIKDKDSIKQKMDELATQRREKQPSNPSAGSTFKRGEDFITAKLIDECGLKGYRIGGAQISEKHAGFIINKENATAKDVIELIQYVKEQIKIKFNKQIQTEIEIIGE